MSSVRAGLLTLAMLVALPMSVSASSDPVALANKAVPRMVCSESEDKQIALRRGMVEARLNSGAVHAAYAEVLALPAEIAEVALLRATILRRLGRPEAAYWYQALLKTCLQAEAAHGLGLLHAGKGQWSEARERLVEATRLRPTDSAMQSDLGYVMLNLAQFSEAEFAFRVAHELQPEAALPRANLQLLAILSRNQILWRDTSQRWPLSQESLEQLMTNCSQMLTSSPHLAAVNTACLLP